MSNFYVDDADQTTVVCPKCGFAKQIDTTKYKGTQKKLKAKCKCGEVFKFTIEYRKYYRKNVRLPGEYHVQESGDQGEIIIDNLSLGGIQFETLKQHRVSQNNILTLKFRLDNTARTEIHRSAKVMWIKGHNIGAEFIDPKLFERDLAFYLRS
ncbi:MAG: PilZ domain-containing protein [Desulfobacterales bacterium]